MPQPNLAEIRNEAIKLAELYAAMEVHARTICECSHKLAAQLKHTAPLGDLEGALVEVIRRRPLPVHFEALSSSARSLAYVADQHIAQEIAASGQQEPDLPEPVGAEVAHA